MKPTQADANREPGHKFDRRFDGYLPPEGVALATVRIVFRVLLLHGERGAEVGEAFGPVASAWADRGGLSISQECQHLGNEFVKKYLLVDNPTLVPVLLDAYYCQAIADERGADWTSFRVDTLSRNPSPLGRPNDRRGAKYYAEALRKTSAQGDRHDLGSIWRYAEAWVEVRHEIAKSLMVFVERQDYRARAKEDGEVSDIETRYRNWRRGLKAIDQTLKRRDLVSFSR